MCTPIENRRQLPDCCAGSKMKTATGSPPFHQQPLVEGINFIEVLLMNNFFSATDESRLIKRQSLRAPLGKRQHLQKINLISAGTRRLIF
jgi:hypothetical protein